MLQSLQLRSPRAPRYRASPCTSCASAAGRRRTLSDSPHRDRPRNRGAILRYLLLAPGRHEVRSRWRLLPDLLQPIQRDVHHVIHLALGQGEAPRAQEHVTVSLPRHESSGTVGFVSWPFLQDRSLKSSSLGTESLARGDFSLAPASEGQEDVHDLLHEAVAARIHLHHRLPHDFKHVKESTRPGRDSRSRLPSRSAAPRHP